MIVTFRLAEHRHALPASVVRRALRAAEVTPAPAPRETLLGTLEVEGETLPVLSLRRRLGLGDDEITPDTHFLIASLGAGSVVLPVDEVLGVAPSLPLPEGLVLIPDLEKLFGRPPHPGPQ